MMKNLWLFNKNKIKILSALYLCKNDMECCSLLEGLGISKNLLSYHVSQLRTAGFILEEKVGKRRIYKLNKENKKFVGEILKILEII